MLKDKGNKENQKYRQFGIIQNDMKKAGVSGKDGEVQVLFSMRT